ncbi:MAG: phage tail sheath subtilisin-like domain-containing protein [Betaproteobacteria bacterium]|jgi:phage tail sheath protein FI|nr:phage tail sheath subtilisin-like domain-containing protein [Betaproteobacteria bacterium]
MGNMKTPGVYIVEKNAFPNSVVEVATAVPAFVGYTEKAENRGNSLLNKPWRITSMAEFHQYFGFSPTADLVRFSLEKLSGAAPAPDANDPLAARDAEPMHVRGQGYLLKQTEGFYTLYYSLLSFFQNGGGPCYIVSVGGYKAGAGVNIEADKLMGGIAELAKEQEPTMVLAPEAVLLKKDGCDQVQQAALKHCGEVMKNRIAILDIWKGYQERSVMPDCVAGFRDKLGINFLSYATAYYPWLNTSIVQEQDLSYSNIDAGSQDALIECITDELSGLGTKPEKLKAQLEEIAKIKTAKEAAEIALLAKSLMTMSPFFAGIMGEMRRRLNVLPPGPAMAGVYTMVDNARGVWKAPANVSLNSVVSPTTPISNEQQEDLNVTPQGKSINAIRAFIGEGTLVWGARTLDGNSLDWRYINVRRTMIMLEESIRLAAKSMVFEPNVANTWVTMKSMIRNFLTGIWKRGGLAGAVPDDAFSVHVGLGETMTPEDILEGILRVTVLVAITRPAEFIEITFQQQMQKS